MMIAFGISSLFFAILGVFIPLVGIFITGISGFLAWMSAGKGTPLGAAAVIINLINLFLLSPGYMLVIGLEAQHRTPDQSKSFTIWMIVLFIQIAAIVVFIVNVAMDRIDFRAALKSLKNKNPSKIYSNRSESEMESNQMKPKSDNTNPGSDEEPGKTVSPLAKTLIYKIRGGKKLDSKFWESEFGNYPRNIEDIAFDGTKPHRAFLSQKKAQLRIFSIVISCIVLVFMLVFLRPDLFPFLKYSSVFNVFSKTFPEKYLDQFKANQPSPGSTIAEGSKNKTIAQFPTENHKEPDVSIKEISPDQNAINRKYWYIIELQSGENIITQNAIETDGLIDVWAYDGRERKLRRNEVKSVKKTTF